MSEQEEYLGQVQELLEQVSAKVVKHSTDLDDQAELLVQLGKKLVEQDENLDWLVGKYTERIQKNTPAKWNWRYLSGEDRAQLWQVLRAFVDWINDRYFSHHYDVYIPGCWYRHPRVVEELTALWAGWHSAYHHHQRPNAEAAYFHERILWPCLDRIEPELQECLRAREHVQQPRTVWVTDEGFDDWVAEDAALTGDQEALAQETRLIMPSQDEIEQPPHRTGQAQEGLTSGPAGESLGVRETE